MYSDQLESALGGIDRLLEGRASAITRDLKLNLKRILSEGALPPEESLPALLAVATSVEHRGLASLAVEELTRRDFTFEQVQEATESAAILGMLNTYYRFKHMLGKEDEYRTAGLRMTALARPVLGKERFELLAFALSVLGGCEMCIRSHEKVLRDSGASVEKVHDLSRLAAVVKGLKSLSLAA